MERPRVAKYIKNIRVVDGIVITKLGKEISNRDANPNGQYAHNIDAQYLQPNQSILLTATYGIKIEVYTKDEDTGRFYDLDEYIESNEIEAVEVRGFFSSPVRNLSNRKISFEGFIYGDIVFRQ